MAPREVRPAEEATPDRNELLAELRGLVARLERFLDDADRGKVRVTHAYFGPLKLERSLRLAAVHTEHHERQVAQTPRPAEDPSARPIER